MGRLRTRFDRIMSQLLSRTNAWISSLLEKTFIQGNICGTFFVYLYGYSSGYLSMFIFATFLRGDVNPFLSCNGPGLVSFFNKNNARLGCSTFLCVKNLTINNIQHAEQETKRLLFPLRRVRRRVSDCERVRKSTCPPPPSLPLSLSLSAHIMSFLGNCRPVQCTIHYTTLHSRSQSSMLCLYCERRLVRATDGIDCDIHCESAVIFLSFFFLYSLEVSLYVWNCVCVAFQGIRLLSLGFLQKNALLRFGMKHLS